MRTSARAVRGFRRERPRWRVVIVSALLAGGVSPAAAAMTPQACLAKKLNEWGKLRQCEATENSRALLAKSADPAKCRTRFDARLATLDAHAAAAAVPCRFGVNGDGTAIDYDTGLQWEQKTDDGSIHDEQNQYTWSSNRGRPDGTIFSSLLATLNTPTSADGTTSTGCFAGHCDWRLPSIVELHGIVDLSAPGCRRGGGCLDETVFGPTMPFFYWSATTETDFPVFAWGVAFGAAGSVVSAIEDDPLFARAVRLAL